MSQFSEGPDTTEIPTNIGFRERQSLYCNRCGERTIYAYNYCATCLDDFISKGQATDMLGCSLLKLNRMLVKFPNFLTLYPYRNQHRLSRTEVLVFAAAQNDLMVKDIKIKWSPKFLKCRICKTTEIKHYGGGYCLECYPNSKEFTILNGYMCGNNLSELGDAMGITRERARQLFDKAVKIEANKSEEDSPSMTENELHEQFKNLHKQNRAEREYKDIIEKNYDVILEQLSNHGIVGEMGLLGVLGMPRSVMHLVESQYPEFLEVVSHNKHRWSWKYDQCRMCGTKDVKHKRWGYCQNCYTKSEEWRDTQGRYRLNHLEEYRERSRVYGAAYSKRPEVKERLRLKTHEKNFDGNREEAFRVYGDKCFDCGITRSDFQKKYGKDLSVYHVDGDASNNNVSNLRPLCISCLGKER